MSLRDDQLQEIAELTGTEDKAIKMKRLSAPQVHAVYQEVTGEEPEPFKGATHHLNIICEELEIDLYRTLHSGNQTLPTDALKQVLTFLRQQ